MQSSGFEPEFPSWHVELSTEGGPRLAMGLHEIQSTLRVNVDDARGLLTLHQPLTDAGGEPMGSFLGELSDDLVGELKQTLPATDLSAVGQGSGGGPGSSLLTLRKRLRGQSQEVAIPSRDIERLQKVQGLLELLNLAIGQMLQHPYAAVKLSVQRAAGGPKDPLRFEVSLTNVGRIAIAFRNPTTAPSSAFDDTETAGVRYALMPPVQPGYTPPPLEWHRVELERSADAPAYVVLKPGASARVRTREIAGAAGALLVQAFAASYQPHDDVDGAPVLRGRVLSEGLETP